MIPTVRHLKTHGKPWGKGTETAAGRATRTRRLDARSPREESLFSHLSAQEKKRIVDRVRERREADPLHERCSGAGVKCKWVCKIQTCINIHTSIYLYMYSLDIQCLGCIIALSLQGICFFSILLCFLLFFFFFFSGGFWVFFFGFGGFALKKKKN